MSTCNSHCTPTEKDTETSETNFSTAMIDGNSKRSDVKTGPDNNVSHC